MTPPTIVHYGCPRCHYCVSRIPPVYDPPRCGKCQLTMTPMREIPKPRKYRHLS